MHLSTEITVGVPCEQTMALFTPEGERRWADGGDPTIRWLTVAKAPGPCSSPDTEGITRRGS